MEKLRLAGPAVLTIIVSLLVFGCGSNNSAQTAGAGTQTDTVSIQNFTYSPGEITVSVGDTVTWVNNDSTDHTVTGDNNGTDDAFDSGVIHPGGQYSHTFTAAGAQPYHCTIHTFMHGTVTVHE
jgi:plastocyanin